MIWPGAVDLDADLPLQPNAPPTWQGREHRVEWCIQHLTKGEKAFLYRMLHAEGARIDTCHEVERRERKELNK